MIPIASGWAWWGLACVFLMAPASSAQTSKDDPPQTTKLHLTKPILCKEIRGYEDYDKRLGDAFTKDEKLLVYYRPLDYEEKRLGTRKQVHFTQEIKIRKRGQKNAAWAKKDELEYKKLFQPPASVYLENTVSLKDMKPGEYEYEIVLTDKIGGETATRTFPFKVVESKPTDDVEPKKEPPRSNHGKKPRNLTIPLTTR
jgi:hypothetical protein